MSAIKTIQVVIKDFKTLKNLKADINGCNVFLRGKNGLGKSSFMDFVEIALGKTSIVPPNTNVEGQVLVDKDGVTYKFSVRIDSKTNKPIVTVTLPDGNSHSTKSMIAGIVGANTFDVDKFVNLSTTEAGRKQQVEEFKKFLDDETREFLAKYEASVKSNFDQRTDVNRDIKKLEGSINLHPMANHMHDLLTFKETKTEDVLADLKAAQSHNEKVNKVVSNIEDRNKKIDTANEDIAELESKINALKMDVQANEDLNIQAKEWLVANTIKPTAELERKLTDAGKDNTDYVNAQNLIKELDNLNVLRKDSEKLTKLIESERDMIKNAIRDMDGPIQGLAFDDEQLLYNGIAVHPTSLSKSEIKKLGIRLKIAENPDLPLFIHEAECMDEDSLREIQDLADECGLQMFAEEVQRGVTELQIEIQAFS